MPRAHKAGSIAKEREYKKDDTTIHEISRTLCVGLIRFARLLHSLPGLRPSGSGCPLSTPVAVEYRRISDACSDIITFVKVWWQAWSVFLQLSFGLGDDYSEKNGGS